MKTKELITSILIIATTTILLSSATFSFFTDKEISKRNILIAGDLDLRFVAPGECELAISFLAEDNFIGVDSPTGWSNGNNMVNLGVSHWDLLGGTADVNAYRDGDTGTLTHRGTRGLGVFGDENDEIDNKNIDTNERIVITFDTPHYLCGFEIRSLYIENYNGNSMTEQGDVKLFLCGNEVGYYHLEADGEGGIDGILAQDVPHILVDKIVFYLEEKGYNSWSEYAVARIYLSGECVQDNEFYRRVGAVWEMYDMKPGMETDGIIVFNEMGSNYGGSLEISCEYEAREDNDGNASNGFHAGPEPDTDLTTGSNETSTDAFAANMTIVEMIYYSDGNAIDLLTNITTLHDMNGNGWMDLYDLKHDIQHIMLNSNGANGDYLYMKIKFREDAGNDYQGDIFYLNMIFTLKQKGMP
mgnify:CR=1 FL=1